MGSEGVKIIVFDLDGTLIESNRLKYEAFFEIFSGVPSSEEVIGEVLRTFREKPRFDIIRMVIENLRIELGSCAEDTDNLVSLYAEAYNRIVEQGAVNCPEKSGCSYALKTLHRHFPLFINSATPIDPLKRIVVSRGIAGYFAGVYGFPPDKLENLKNIIKRSCVQPSEVCFVGDGQSDLDAAKSVGTKFIGITNQHGGLKGDDILLLDDLIDFSFRFLS